MTTVEITASYSGYVYGYNRDTSFGFANGDLFTGYQKSTFTTSVYRAFLKFDTSSLSGETVSQVNLRLTCRADSSDLNDFDVQIVKQDWSTQDPIAAGTREDAFDGCLDGTADNSIWRNTSGISTNTPYTSGNLDTSWVNTSGDTYYSLISSRDKSGDMPVSNGSEYVWLRPYSDATAEYRPILVVTYGEAPPASSTPIHLIRTGMQPGMRIGL